MATFSHPPQAKMYETAPFGIEARLLRRRLISGRDYFVNLIYSYATHIIHVIDFISR